LMDVFQSLINTRTHEKKTLCERLCAIRFLPVSCGLEWNQVGWVSLRDIIWPIEKTGRSQNSQTIADSWFASLPNAYYLCPCLPILDVPQMKLVYLLVSQISPELLRFDSSDFISLMWADLNRWYFSFGASGVDERNDALLFLWKLCKGGAGISMLPCVPTQRICFGSRNNCNYRTFKCLDEDFYFLSHTNSSEQEIDTSQWFSLLEHSNIIKSHKMCQISSQDGLTLIQETNYIFKVLIDSISAEGKFRQLFLLRFSPPTRWLENALTLSTNLSFQSMPWLRSG
jgi:hypothetical protein